MPTQVVPIRLLLAGRPGHDLEAVFHCPLEHPTEAELVPGLGEGSGRRTWRELLLGEIVFGTVTIPHVDHARKPFRIRRQRETHQSSFSGASRTLKLLTDLGKTPPVAFFPPRLVPIALDLFDEKHGVACDILALIEAHVGNYVTFRPMGVLPYPDIRTVLRQH